MRVVGSFAGDKTNQDDLARFAPFLPKKNKGLPLAFILREIEAKAYH